MNKITFPSYFLVVFLGLSIATAFIKCQENSNAPVLIEYWFDPETPDSIGWPGRPKFPRERCWLDQQEITHVLEPFEVDTFRANHPKARLIFKGYKAQVSHLIKCR